MEVGCVQSVVILENALIWLLQCQEQEEQATLAVLRKNKLTLTGDKMGNIKIVNVSDEDEFIERCNDILKDDDYRLSSSYCGFANSEAYDFCDSWMAIFVKQDNQRIEVMT